MLQLHIDPLAYRHCEHRWVHKETGEEHLLICWTGFPFYSLSPAFPSACFNIACQIKCCFHLHSRPSQNGTLGKHLSSLRLPCAEILCAVLGMRYYRVPQSLLKTQLQPAKLAVKLLFKIGISGISEILLKISETLGNTTQLFPQSIAQRCLGSCLPFCQEPSSPTEK